MKCPNCPAVTLTMTERQGVEIDYCPECRGVWLDRGELDKLIEKSAAPAPFLADSPVSYRETKHDHRDDYRKEHYYKKKKSFLADFFD